LNDEQAQVYRAIAGGPRAGGPFPLTDAKGSLRGPFNAMLLSPPVGLALQAVGASVRYHTVLTDRIREMAILVVAAHWGSDFERESHEAAGRACGLAPAELSALRRGSVPDLTDPVERLAVRTVTALTENNSLTDEEYLEAVKALG
jgi:4-carboxymuconolactone decarboxylase